MAARVAETIHGEARYPCLDGLRAVAIALVCFGHLAWNQRFFGTSGQYLKLGELGVRIFFVLSGFLITGILLRELETAATLSLRSYYFRRTLRIFPAFYAFVGVMIIANSTNLAHLFHGSPLPSLSFTADYLVPGKRVFGHTWSLAVEEQFYLLWPTALVLLGRRRGLWLPALMLVACPLMRVVSYVIVSHHTGLQEPQFRFDTQADALALGCLLYGFRAGLHGREWYCQLLASRPIVLAPCLGLCITLIGRQQQGLLYAVYLVAGYAVTNGSIALFLDRCITFPRGAVGRLLNAAPVVGLGVISYSVYLWQAPFLFVGRSAWWQAPPTNIVLTMVAATGSYFLVERPCLRLRKRWEQRLFPRQMVSAGPRLEQAEPALRLGVAH